jgi:hypothetical protein
MSDVKASDANFPASTAQPKVKRMREKIVGLIKAAGFPDRFPAENGDHFIGSKDRRPGTRQSLLPFRQSLSRKNHWWLLAV